MEDTLVQKKAPIGATPKNLLRLFLTSESYFYFLRLFLKPLRKYTAKEAKIGNS